VSASERYLVLEFGFNSNQGCSGVGTAFPYLFSLALHPWLHGMYGNAEPSPETRQYVCAGGLDIQI